MTQGTSTSSHHKAAAICAALGILFNLLGVLAASALSGAYRPEALDAWVISLSEQPLAGLWMSLFFTLGMLALLPLCWQLALRSGGWAQLGAWSIGLGALMNAAGTLTPLAVAMHMHHHLSRVIVPC